MLLTPALYNFSPLYNNFNNGVFTDNRTENYMLQFSIYYIYPGFDPENHFLLTNIINIFLSYLCAILVCGIDILLSLMAFQIIGHIQALIHDLQCMPKPKQPFIVEVFCGKTNMPSHLYQELYDTQENSFVRGKIVKFVKHHRHIVR